MHTFLLSGHICIRARSPNALSTLHYNYMSKVMHYDYHYHFFVKSYETFLFHAYKIDDFILREKIILILVGIGQRSTYIKSRSSGSTFLLKSLNIELVEKFWGIFFYHLFKVFFSISFKFPVDLFPFV